VKSKALQISDDDSDTLNSVSEPDELMGPPEQQLPTVEELLKEANDAIYGSLAAKSGKGVSKSSG
jgi:hypothetical protein